MNLYALKFPPSVLSRGEFAMAAPTDWNRGPVSLDLVWGHPDAAAANNVSWSAIIHSAAPSGVFSDGTTRELTGVSAGVDTVFVNTLKNIYPTDYESGTTLHFEIMRDGTADTLDVDAYLYGATLHYTPTGCDTNLNCAFYFAPDGGQSYGGTWYTEIETTDASIPITALASVESNTYATLTFEVEFSGAEGAFNLVVSTDGTSFSSASVAVPVLATSATVTVDLASQVVTGEVITIAPDEALNDPWRLVGVIASTLSAPSGCVTGIA
jgi:hypothetical protein